MDRFQSTIEVHAPASVCYQQWHQFDKFPRFMNNVKSVEQIDGNRWHWVVNGPFGKDIEWDAQIDGDERNKVISWHTVENPDVGVQGAVRFDEIASNKTQVTCTIQYEPPAGILGDIAAHLLSNPQKMVEEDLNNFKNLVEGTNIPAEKARQGAMQPDPFVVGGAASQANEISGSADYNRAGLREEDRIDELSLEDDTPVLGTSADLDRVDIIEVQTLSFEEDPYLGENGALYSEDLIDMRADKSFVDEQDVFTQSMDVEEEDLESFYEDIDEEVTNQGLIFRETIETYEIKESGGLVNSDRINETGQQ